MSISDCGPRQDATENHGSLRDLRHGPLAAFVGSGPALEIGDARNRRQDAIARQSHDTVIADHRLQTVADYRAALQAWFGAVRIGGHLLIVVPHDTAARPREGGRSYTPGLLMAEIEEALAPNSYRVRWLSDEVTDLAGRGDARAILLAIERIAPPAWGLVDVPKVKAPAPDFAFEPNRTRVEVAALRPCRKILILKLDRRGDFLLGLPALERARAAFAGSEITLMVGPWNLTIARQLDLADHVLAFNAFPPLAADETLDRAAMTAGFRALAGEAYDLAIDLRLEPDTRFLLAGADTPIRAGIGTHTQFPWLDIFLPVDLDPHRNEAVADTFDHDLFAAAPEAVRGEFRTFWAKENARSDEPVIWGADLPLRQGRYWFEPFIEFVHIGTGLLSFDIMLDGERVSRCILPARKPIRLPFVVEKADASFGFRIAPLREAPAIDFSFFGGRLMREDMPNILPQAEYLSLLIELIAMRVARFGLLGSDLEKEPEKGDWAMRSGTEA